MSSIFKGLIQDSYSVLKKVLETCWAGLWSDAKVKRTLKVALFNEATVSHVCIVRLRFKNDSQNDVPDPQIV